MTFAKKLYLLLAAAVAGLVVLSTIGVFQIQTVYTAANYANENSLPSIESLDEALQATYRMQLLTWKHLTANNEAEKAKLLNEINENQHVVASALDKYEKEYISDDKDRAMLEKDRKVLLDYYALRDGLMKLSASGNLDEARHQQMSIDDQVKLVNAALKEHLGYNVKLAAAGADTAAATLHNAAMQSAAISVAITLCVMLGGTFLVRKLVRALREAVALAEAVAGGNLTERIESSGHDEVGQLQRALCQMSDKLTTIIGEVQRGARAIEVASTEIASGNMDLSARTEQQASALEETASSMEELTSTVQQNAHNADHARQLSNEAACTAQEGGQVVGKVVETMEAISTASSRIVDIIGVIDSIAFQTNILALNAAVEAARAGDQGRGFAVVATEVRSLAQRAAAAAKEIKGLIDNSASQVQQGSALVEDAGSAMQRIVDSVNRVANVVGEISDASREQSTGIQQVNEAVTQMDDMTQQNAALVEQSAAAAVSMRDQAESLSQLVSQFRMRETDFALKPVYQRTHLA